MSSSLDEAFLLLEVANKLEESCHVESSARTQRLMEASAKYYEAVLLMKRFRNTMPQVDHAESSVHSDQSKTRELLSVKIAHYEKHAQQLMQRIGYGEDAENNPRGGNAPTKPSCTDGISAITECSSSGDSPFPCTNKNDPASARACLANKLLARAILLDEQGKGSEAIADYKTSAKSFFQAIEIDGRGGTISCIDGKSLRRTVGNIIDRIEQLKKDVAQENTKPLQQNLVRAPSVHNVATY